MNKLLPCLALLLAACGSASPESPQAQAGEPCGGSVQCADGLTCSIDGNGAEAIGTCVRPAAPERSAAWFAQRVDERMTEGDVRAVFGPPDRDIGGDVHIFVYLLEDGSEVWIGLADRVLYARNVDSDGNLIEVLTDGEVLQSMDAEPLTFAVPAGMQVTKRTQAAGTATAADPAPCTGAKTVDLGDGERTLYVITDQDGAAAYVLSVVPNGPQFADAARSSPSTSSGWRSDCGPGQVRLPQLPNNPSSRRSRRDDGCMMDA